MTERFAIYYTPPPDTHLALLAAQWLDRDASGAAIEPVATGSIPAPDRRALTASARRYGFHATIKAPMRLRPGHSRADLEAALSRFAGNRAAVRIGRLLLREIDGFLALVPERQSAELTHFADAVVDHFEPFRAPLTEAERQRRIHDGRLDARQVALLDRYGYPYVGDDFQFHMTLTGRLAENHRQPVLDVLGTWFDPALGESYTLDRLALFHEPEPNAPFQRVADFPLAAEMMADA